MDDVCEQLRRWLSAQKEVILVGRDQDGGTWVARVIDIDPSWQCSSKDTRYCKMISACFLKQRRDGWISGWF